MKKKRSKLFRRYLFNIFLIIIISLTLMSALFLGIFASRWKTEQSNTLLNSTNIVANNVQTLIHNYHDNALIGIAPVYVLANTINTMCDANDCDIFISDLNGNVILCREMINNNKTKENQCDYHSNFSIPDDVLAKAIEGNYSDITLLGDTYRIDQLVVATPIMSGNKTIGLVFASKEVISTIFDYVSEISKVILFSALIVLVASAIIGYCMAYRITKPLRQMSYATKQYADGDFSFKVKVKGHDELSDLAAGLNKMASSLSVLESSRRNFVANVSHELKTPMTTIGGFIDGILDGTIPPEKESYYLNIVSEEVKRLSRLVTGMLNMSKLEAGEMQINEKNFDISESLIKTLLNFETKINAKSIEIEGLDTLESINVNADEDMIMQVIYNLIDNAIKFTPNNGYIHFKTFADSEKAYVTIRNSGEGISKDELEKVFERFYKIDKSRSYDVRGAGLGLYIVQNIINLHGGEIKATSDGGNYADFSFWIPINKNKQ